MRLVLASALGLLALAGGASAADLRAPAPMYAKAPPTSAVFSWTGFYIGANIGGVWTRDDAIWNPLPDPVTFGTFPFGGTISSNSVAGGVHGGYNYQVSSSFVAGIEADFTDTGSSGAISAPWANVGGGPCLGGFAPCTTTLSSKLDWLATLRGRLGYLVTPSLLAYATGGGAWGHIEYAADAQNGGAGGLFLSAPVAFSKTASGYVVGGGLEWMFAPHWMARGEYLFYHLNSSATAVAAPAAFPAAASAYSWNDMSVNEGRVGISYKF